MCHLTNVIRTTMMKKFIASRTVIKKKVLGVQNSQIPGERNNPIETMMSLRKEMDEMKSALKEKSSRNSDGILKRTDSLFTGKVLECPFLRVCSVRFRSVFMGMANRN